MKLEQVPTPAYVVDLARLESNEEIHLEVQKKSRLQSFASQKAIPLQNLSLISQYLSGTIASGLLMKPNWQGKNFLAKSMFCASFQGFRLGELLEITDHIVF